MPTTVNHSSPSHTATLPSVCEMPSRSAVVAPSGQFGRTVVVPEDGDLDLLQGLTRGGAGNQPDQVAQQ
jgi:hypothetical protein